MNNYNQYNKKNLITSLVLCNLLSVTINIFLIF